MKKWILTLLCSLSLLSIQAQQAITITFTGKVTDSESGELIKDARVYIEHQEKQQTRSNRAGHYTLTVTLNPQSPAVLVVSDMRYEIFKHSLKKQDIRKADGDTIRVDAQLRYRMLPDMQVSAAPDVVFSSKEIHVSDFEFYEDNLVLLVYEKRLQKSSKVAYADKNQQILSSFTIPDVAKELYRDFAGRIYVIAEKRNYEVSVRDDILSLLPIEKEYFEKQIEPWVDTTELGAYFSNFLWFYPEFNYYLYNRYDSTANHLRTIIDKPLMELYRAQYKYVSGRDKLQALRAELATGIDKEIWVAIWSGFPNSIYYHQLYAPMFVREDTVLIFDHYSNKLYSFDSENRPLDSIDISYHTGTDKKEWEHKLVQDYETRDIYSVYLRGGKYHLKELNTATGEIRQVYRLYYKYPERLRVKDGYAYYIYRPFESLQKKYLYREKIK